MQLYSNWATDVTYSFDTTVPGILPTSYQQVKLISRSNFEIAKMIEGANAYAMWRRIFPSLSGIQDDPNSVEWLIFQAIDGSKITLANPWIQASSVTSVQFVQQRIVLTQTSDAQVAQVVGFLKALQIPHTSERIYS